MSHCRGTILDATAIIDFHWLGQWDWLNRQHGPLFMATEVLTTDGLCATTKDAARKHLTRLSLETDSEFALYMRLSETQPGLSPADRATLALALERSLNCATDDQLLVVLCVEHGVKHLRTLQLLAEMVHTGYRSKAQIVGMARKLIAERGKWISNSVLEAWELGLARQSE